MATYQEILDLYKDAVAEFIATGGTVIRSTGEGTQIEVTSVEQATKAMDDLETLIARENRRTNPRNLFSRPSISRPSA